MSGPVGHMAYPHGLRRGSQVLWKHPATGGSAAWREAAPTTVLTVTDTKQITVEGAPPFYRGSQGGPDANFTHVVVTFEGLPFPCIFGAGDTVLGWSESHRGSD